MSTKGLAWALLLAANVTVLSFMLGSRVGNAQGPGQQPFANAVQQRAEMIRELREIKTLMKEQNALLRELSRAGDQANR